ncbi:MAG: rhomboid family intramembrane serine protease [Deltaproteobacteria bacterium]|nr:rhomboid family intramembrane serine protease [Deltaproteobacteria bacterium]
MFQRPGLRRWFDHLSKGVRLIIIGTVSVHIVLLVLRVADERVFNAVFMRLALTPSMLTHFELQGLLTSIFIHDPHNIFHILLNMMGLYFLGPVVERRIGLRNFMVLYLGAGLCGSIVYSSWAFLFSDTGVPVIGASGAVLGVLTAFALMYPNVMIRLWMFAPMRAKNLIWLAIGLDVVMLFSDSSVAVPAHMGGMLGGYLYIRRPWRPQYRRAVVRDLHRWMERRR